MAEKRKILLTLEVEIWEPGSDQEIGEQIVEWINDLGEHAEDFPRMSLVSAYEIPKYDEAGEYVCVEEDGKALWRGHAGPTEEEDELRVIKLDAKTWPVGTVISAKTPQEKRS